MDLETILNHELSSHDFEEVTTVKGYLEELLLTLWKQGERFNGKRPFGNSGWEYDLYKPLIECGAVEGSLDSDGCIETLDENAADALVIDLIEEIFK